MFLYNTISWTFWLYLFLVFRMTCLFLARNLAVKTHNEVTPFYRHFEPSETFGTDSHQVRNTITVRLTHAQTFFRGVNNNGLFIVIFCYWAKHWPQLGMHQRIVVQYLKNKISLKTITIGVHWHQVTVV
jgi:hypothetical protein